ncbi:hypothetical protein RNZ50_00400 [Paracoccaceae bacterium Fryx2]|nr:hypothetical protein [Paracoccaceae bacterium Fryx2]
MAYYPDIGYLLPAGWNAPETIIHGHFVRRNGQAVETVCSGADQYITVLRDPFQVVVSAYFYGKKEGMSWATAHSLEWFMEWWLKQEQGPLMSALPTIKGYRSVEDYAASFIQIGVVSRMTEFYAALGGILGVEFAGEKIVNASAYGEDIPDLEPAFRKRFPLDFDLFDFADRATAG